jgi:hypothetical protein
MGGVAVAGTVLGLAWGASTLRARRRRRRGGGGGPGGRWKAQGAGGRNTTNTTTQNEPLLSGAGSPERPDRPWDAAHRGHGQGRQGRQGPGPEPGAVSSGPRQCGQCGGEIPWWMRVDGEVSALRWQYSSGGAVAGACVWVGASA